VRLSARMAYSARSVIARSVCIVTIAYIVLRVFVT
jgi:hypothetical protein